MTSGRRDQEDNSEDIILRSGRTKLIGLHRENRLISRSAVEERGRKRFGKGIVHWAAEGQAFPNDSFCFPCGEVPYRERGEMGYRLGK